MLCSLSRIYSQIKSFANCPARAAAACSRRSVRYYVSLVSLETPHSGCPKAPPARREGGSILSTMLCSLSRIYSQIKSFANCPARAAAACSRRSVRYYVSLVSLETPHSGCPKAPPARREGSSVRFAMLCFKSLRMQKREKRTLFLDKPLSDCPARAAAACSRRSVQYCVSLMALETTLSECPQQNNKDNTPLYDMNSNTPQC